jgi:hypothetical protein
MFGSNVTLDQVRRCATRICCWLFIVQRALWLVRSAPAYILAEWGDSQVGWIWVICGAECLWYDWMSCCLRWRHSKCLAAT